MTRINITPESLKIIREEIIPAADRLKTSGTLKGNAVPNATILARVHQEVFGYKPNLSCPACTIDAITLIANTFRGVANLSAIEQQGSTIEAATPPTPVEEESAFKTVADGIKRFFEGEPKAEESSTEVPPPATDAPPATTEEEEKQ